MTDNTQPEALRDARWYMVDKDGMATLCTDREDAEQEAKDANMAWPHTAPHRAVQLVEVGTAAAELHRQHARITELEARVQELGAMARENRSRRIVELEAQLEAIGAGGVSGPLMGKRQEMPDLTELTERGAKAWAGVDAQGLREGFTAADMATAAAQGFRDGVASCAASAGSEPVAFLVCTEEGDPDMVFLSQHDAQQYLEYDERPTPLYTHPSSPEGTVGVWQDIATAPKDGTRILLHPAIEVADAWSKGHWNDENKCWIVGGSPSGIAHTSWAPLPPAPPTTSAGSGKGE